MFLWLKNIIFAHICADMELDKKLYAEINDYCKLNGLKTRDFIHKILKDAFLKEKYADTPFMKPSVSVLETEAVAKIKDIVENQVSLPPEIAEMVDEHFFDMLVTEEKPDKDSKPEPPEVQTVLEPITGGISEKKSVKPVTNRPNVGNPKKKRSLN